MCFNHDKLNELYMQLELPLLKGIEIIFNKEEF